MNVTTRDTDTPMDASDAMTSSSGQDESSCYALSVATPFSLGESSSMTADRKASTAPSSGMSRNTAARISYAKLTRLLMQSGLIAGITPMSIRRRSVQQTLAFVLSAPAGVDATERKED
jgi:hypothetical protein